MQAYVDRTSSRIYIHSDTVYQFRHVFTSQVPNKANDLHFPATAFAAIDRGVPIDVLNTCRWASGQVFDKFYDRARLHAVAPSIGLTSLA